MSSADSTNVAPPAAIVPPPAPRDVTPTASRRAWNEPRVHFWWIVAIGLVLGATFLAAQIVVTWNDDARLIRSGKRIDATVWLYGARVKGRPISPEDSATIEFQWNGQPVILTNQRITGREEKTFAGDTIPIYVDPDDPQHWTARSSPASLPKLLIGAMSLVAVAAILALVGVAQRRGVLATWRTGDARQAAIVETSQTALAPRSRLVRCALTDSTDRRLITVYVPHRVANFQPGDPLWVIMPPGRPDKALAAASFV
jgi:hypothetical protein